MAHGTASEYGDRFACLDPGKVGTEESGADHIANRDRIIIDGLFGQLDQTGIPNRMRAYSELSLAVTTMTPNP